MAKGLTSKQDFLFRATDAPRSSYPTSGVGPPNEEILLVLATLGVLFE